MPIFAYRCESCGLHKDALQKRSDPPLITCPECGRDTLVKLLTAPAFQLKGSGWYVTDFRDGKGKSASGKEAGPASADAAPAAANGAAGEPAPKAAAKATESASGTASSSDSAAASAPGAKASGASSASPAPGSAA